MNKRAKTGTPLLELAQIAYTVARKRPNHKPFHYQIPHVAALSFSSVNAARNQHPES